MFIGFTIPALNPIYSEGKGLLTGIGGDGKLRPLVSSRNCSQYSS